MRGMVSDEQVRRLLKGPFLLRLWPMVGLPHFSHITPYGKLEVYIPKIKIASL